MRSEVAATDNASPIGAPGLRPRATTPEMMFNHGNVAQRDLSATDVRYNAVLLQKEEELTTKEVFEREPRDPVFAPIFEARLGSGYSRAAEELGFKDKVIKIKSECKTLSCYTEISVAKEDGGHVYDVMNGLILGDVETPGLADTADPAVSNLTFYTLYDPRMRDDALFNSYVEQGFVPLIQSIKAEQAQEGKP